MSAKARQKSKNKQIKLYQTKNLLHSKENHQQNEKAVYKMAEKIFANYISDKRLISKICKEFIQLNSK